MKSFFEKFLPGILLSLFFSSSSWAEGASPVAGIADVSSARGVFRAPASNAVDIAENERRLSKAWDLGESKDAIPLEDTTFPIAHYPGGNVRAQFKADKAFLPPDDDDFVRAYGVTVEMFSEKGLFEGVFRALNCIYDRSTRSGYCPGAVLILYRNIEITGSNMVWHVENRNARILARSKVVLNRFSDGMKGAFKR